LHGEIFLHLQQKKKLMDNMIVDDEISYSAIIQDWDSDAVRSIQSSYVMMTPEQFEDAINSSKLDNKPIPGIGNILPNCYLYRYDSASESLMLADPDKSLLYWQFGTDKNRLFKKYRLTYKRLEREELI